MYPARADLIAYYQGNGGFNVLREQRQGACFALGLGTEFDYRAQRSKVNIGNDCMFLHQAVN